MAERFLVTGALGCIGAWTVRQLVREGTEVVALDHRGSDHRLRQLLGADELDAVQQVDCDITDLAALTEVLRSHAITRVVHLAALQVPFCRADPALGARVNVVGTVNMFEALKAAGGISGPLAFASSVAVYDDADSGSGGGVASEPTGHASTHYGVYKLANEGTARVYWADDGISSVGLRPYVVYGVGRDQGMTASPTFAMLAAAAGRPYAVAYSGRCHLQLASDVADAFIAVARSQYAGADVFNLGGAVVDIDDVIGAIEAALPGSTKRITVTGAPLPFPAEVEHGRVAEIGAEPFTPLTEGVLATVRAFSDLLDRGLIDVDAMPTR
jgi:UDP-glucuronate 4-epimerase